MEIFRRLPIDIQLIIYDYYLEICSVEEWRDAHWRQYKGVMRNLMSTFIEVDLILPPLYKLEYKMVHIPFYCGKKKRKAKRRGCRRKCRMCHGKDPHKSKAKSKGYRNKCQDGYFSLSNELWHSNYQKRRGYREEIVEYYTS
jgi:hypothetical protein